MGGILLFLINAKTAQADTAKSTADTARQSAEETNRTKKRQAGMNAESKYKLRFS